MCFVVVHVSFIRVEFRIVLYIGMQKPACLALCIRLDKHLSIFVSYLVTHFLSEYTKYSYAALPYLTYFTGLGMRKRFACLSYVSFAVNNVLFTTFLPRG